MTLKRDSKAVKTVHVSEVMTSVWPQCDLGVTLVWQLRTRTLYRRRMMRWRRLSSWSTVAVLTTHTSSDWRRKRLLHRHRALRHLLSCSTWSVSIPNLRLLMVFYWLVISCVGHWCYVLVTTRWQVALKKHLFTGYYFDCDHS